MNDLEHYFYHNRGRIIHKWKHYFEIYDRHFHRFRGTDVVVMEVGVFHGGSLQMWKSYFGPKAKIIGVDINPDCKAFEEEQIEIYIGSQEETAFWDDLKTQQPKVDILIDDGGHTMRQQIITFEAMYPHLTENGIYLCEDTHTSYWEAWGGGYKREGTFIEYAKNFIDRLHAWHSNDPTLQVDDFTTSTYAMHCYDSVIALEKRKIAPPAHMMTGVGAQQ